MVLGRTGKQRWHLFRTMVTQLVQHERIYTTKAKA
jgi:ribosomal protein L17